MALKPHRNYTRANGDFFMNETAEKGSVVVYDTAAVGGPGLDNPNNLVKKPTANTDPVAGILLETVIDDDPTKCCYNPYKGDAYVCNKVALLNGCDGWVTTNMIDDTIDLATILPGQPAYLSANFGPDGEGLVTNVDAGGSLVGEFLSRVSTVDEEDPCGVATCSTGYVRLKVKC